MRRVLLVWLVLALLTCGDLQMAAAGVIYQSAGLTTGGGGLFTRVGTATQTPGLTVWPVAVDVPALALLPPSISVNFPDRAGVTLARLRAQARGGGKFVWTGRGQGCTAMINAAPNNTYGVISCVTGSYALQGSGATLQLSRFLQTNTTPWEPTSAMPAPVAYAEPIAPRLSGAQIDTVVDVLVLYTEGVRKTLDPGGGSGNTRQFAQAAIDMVQTAMDASTTDGQPAIANVRLVGVSEVTRTDAGDLNDDIRWLDGTPEPNALANFWAADVVMYLTLTGQANTYGRANIPGYDNYPPPGPGFAPYAHGAVVLRCAVLPLDANCPDSYIFAHEFGHIFGANHNPESPLNPTPLEPWAFAHWSRNYVDGGGAHTLVSYYISQCAPAASQCPTVLNYSNAHVYNDWFQTGVADKRENARVIAEFAPTTAQYRSSIGRIFYDGFQN